MTKIDVKLCIFKKIELYFLLLKKIHHTHKQVKMKNFETLMLTLPRELNECIRDLADGSPSERYNSNVLPQLHDVLRYRLNKQKTLFSLMINTHCSGCGRHYLVSLRGYSGEYCRKSCWKDFHYEYDSGYDEDEAFRLEPIYTKYQHLDDVDLRSRAISRYHRNYRNKNSVSGFVWPMIDKPCYNACILNTELAYI